MAHCHTVHLPLGALPICCTVCGAGTSPLPLPHLPHRHGELCEEPPHGHATKVSARKFPAELGAFLRLLRGKDIQPTHLCLGQGLMPFKSRLGPTLEVKGRATRRALPTHRAPRLYC